MNAARAFMADWSLIRYLARRTDRRDDEWLIRRRCDGTLWVAGAPQNIAYAMAGLFDRTRPAALGHWHFYRVRIWRGLLIASPKVFWRPLAGDEFSLAFKGTRFALPPWDDATECRKIAQLARRSRQLPEWACLDCRRVQRRASEPDRCHCHGRAFALVASPPCSSHAAPGHRWTRSPAKRR